MQDEGRDQVVGEGDVHETEKVLEVLGGSLGVFIGKVETIGCDHGFEEEAEGIEGAEEEDFIRLTMNGRHVMVEMADEGVNHVDIEASDCD